MIEKVLKTINKYNMINVDDNCNIVLGLSGGSDSVTLFHVLRQLQTTYNFNLVVVHINHCIREEAIDDEKFCIDLCDKYNIPIFVYKIDIQSLSKKNKITIEEAGRLARYECFNKHIKSDKDKISVAHNKNDVTETFLMRLFRGSGLKGLGSILPVRDNIIRPLINLEKEEIEQYCSSNNFKFIFDKSNLSTEYTRNKVRLNLIPTLKNDFNSEVVNNIFKTSQILSEEDAFLEKLCKKHFDELSSIENNKIYLDVDLLKKLDLVLIRRIFRYSIYHINKDLKTLNYTHIENCLNLLNSQNGSSINLPQNIVVTKQYDKICVTNNIQLTKTLNTKIELNNIYFIDEKKLYLTITNEDLNFENYKNTIINHKIIAIQKLKCIQSKKIAIHSNYNLVLRNRMSSDKIYFRHINGNKKLKKYFIDEKIPREERNDIILLAQENDIFLIFDKHLKISDLNETNEKTVYLKLWEEI